MSTHLSRRWPVLIVAAAVAVIGVAWLAAGSGTDRQPPNGLDRGSARLSPHDTASARAGAAQTTLDFARGSFIALHGYDTRTPRAPWRRELLSRLGTPPASLGALDVDRLIPDAAQWAQMAAIAQRASATIDTVYVPALWTRTAREHPLPDGATGVTVTGTQLVTWAGGSSRVPVAVTVLLVCPPATERCVVSRITARVAR